MRAGLPAFFVLKLAYPVPICLAPTRMPFEAMLAMSLSERERETSAYDLLSQMEPLDPISAPVLPIVFHLTEHSLHPNAPFQT